MIPYGYVDNNPDALYEDVFDTNQREIEVPDFDLIEYGENTVPAECRCSLCGCVFNEYDRVDDAYENKVSPCCLTLDYEELED